MAPINHTVIKTSLNLSLTISVTLAFIAGIAITLWLQPVDRVAAEQIGSSPESGVDSRMKEAYDALVVQGHGSTSVPEWSEDWGTMWNRVMAAASWVPGGDAQASDVLVGKTFYTDARGVKTGTLESLADTYAGLAFQDADDEKCEANNGEDDGACGAGDAESVDEEGLWEFTSSGGTAASVTAHGSTLALRSNKVFQDLRTNLYWSDESSNYTHNQFAYIEGADRVNPVGVSCNFNAAGDANEHCNATDTNVSATELCLNLSLDADDDGVPETAWRLPTQKEVLLAYIHGAGNNLTLNSYAPTLWTSTLYYFSTSTVYNVNLSRGSVNTNSKDALNYIRCVLSS